MGKVKRLIYKQSHFAFLLFIPCCLLYGFRNSMTAYGFEILGEEYFIALFTICLFLSIWFLVQFVSYWFLLKHLKVSGTLLMAHVILTFICLVLMIYFSNKMIHPVRGFEDPNEFWRKSIHMVGLVVVFTQLLLPINLVMSFRKGKKIDH